MSNPSPERGAIRKVVALAAAGFPVSMGDGKVAESELAALEADDD